MIRRKNALLDTALACVERDIPVQAATIAGTPDGDWITDVDAARVVWDVAEPPNLAVTSCPTVAIWRLPRIAGAYGKRLYEQGSTWDLAADDEAAGRRLDDLHAPARNRPWPAGYGR